MSKSRKSYPVIVNEWTKEGRRWYVTEKGTNVVVRRGTAPLIDIHGMRHDEAVVRVIMEVTPKGGRTTKRFHTEMGTHRWARVDAWTAAREAEVE